MTAIAMPISKRLKPYCRTTILSTQRTTKPVLILQLIILSTECFPSYDSQFFCSEKRVKNKQSTKTFCNTQKTFKCSFPATQRELQTEGPTRLGAAINPLNISSFIKGISRFTGERQSSEISYGRRLGPMTPPIKYQILKWSATHS